MNSYLRMLKMIRPYAPQASIAVLFIVLYSFFSVFSFTMISPFLKALFLDENPSVVEVVEEPKNEALLVDPKNEDTETRERLESINQKTTWSDQVKMEALNWANENLLDGTRQDNLLRICLALAILLLLKNVTRYFQDILMVFVGEKVIRDLRNALYLKFTNLPLSFYHQNKAGELISRATNDVLMAQKCVSVSFTTLLRDPIQIVLFLTVAVILSWKLTLMALVMLPASLGVIIRIGKGLRKISHRQQEEMAVLTTNLQETIYGIRVIKAFAMEDFENNKFLKRSDELFKQIFKFNKYMKMSSPLTEVLSSLVGLFILWYGGSKVFTGGLMAPDLFLVFFASIFSLVKPIKNLGQVNNEIQAGMAAADRIFQILDTPSEVAGSVGEKVLDQAEGRVEFDKVDFEYVPGEPVLRDLSLKVNPGEVVALVGSSGGGKSTLIDMIPGFYHPNSGQVLIDGVSVTDLDLGSLRRQMGIVTQEVILFHDTILNNIAYGLENVSLEDVREATRAANADDFIMKLPDGYDTIIGDRGLKLSGGQRQRLSIARAILKNPPILLLDEATSALDTEAEKLVQEAIDRLVKHRTTIVIAHRLSTVKNVDRIYLLEAGKVVQTGTHDELLAAGGRYKELYEMQFQKRS
ncbi:MAG: ABC transporter ATP-binding protein [bacterium]|nr:ABC transporter ATP-binding protein [bacterium]